MKRRDFLGILGAVATWPGVARAQQRIPIIGFVGFATPEVDDPLLMHFRKALAELAAKPAVSGGDCPQVQGPP